MVFLATASACTTFQPISMDQLAASPRLPEQLLVSTAEASRIKLRYPSLEGDSLLGLAANRQMHVRLHKNEITSIRAKKFNADATGLAVMGAIAIGVPVIWVLLIATSGGI